MSGPRNLGKSLELKEDFHSLRFLHEFKHEFVVTHPEQEPDLIDYKAERKQVYANFRYLTQAQIMLIIFLGYEAYTSDEMRANMTTPPENELIVLTRFVCASILHMILISE